MINNQVQLVGLAVGSYSAGSVIGTLPAGLAPSRTLSFPSVAQNGGLSNTIEIRPNGQIVMTQGWQWVSPK